MKILIMGAGAIGSYVGGHLAASGEDVVFCARGENLQALRSRGLQITGVRPMRLDQVRATEDPREFAPYDLILFAVKSYHTVAAGRQIVGCLKPGAAVMTLQNGVENEQRLADLLGRDAVMAGNSRIGAELSAPGCVRHTSNGFVEFGELGGGETARARAYAESFKRAGIFGGIVDNLLDARWEKLIGNAGFNVVAALTRRPLGPILDDPETRQLTRCLMNEAAAAGRAAGARIAPDYVESLLEFGRLKLRGNRPSTLQDVTRGKPLEYDAISGAVIRTAARFGIAVPVTDAMYALLKLIDGGRALKMGEGKTAAGTAADG
jgi:2-dehydropantoate 2-reductase